MGIKNVLPKPYAASLLCGPSPYGKPHIMRSCVVLVYITLCHGLWSFPLSALTMAPPLYAGNIISLCYALLYGYIGYKNRGSHRLIYGGMLLVLCPCYYTNTLNSAFGCRLEKYGSFNIL